MISAVEGKKLSTRQRYAFARRGGKIETTMWQKAAGVFFVVLIAIVVIQANEPLTPEEIIVKEAASKRNGARHICKKYIASNLLVPDSVEYNTVRNRLQVVDDGENQWVTTIDLKSKNAFGVLIAATYQCRVKLENKSYYVVSAKNIK